jgi:predicted DNA-binding protein
MPRPRSLKSPKFTSFIIERDVYERLRAIARQQGKSVSQLVREIVVGYLRSVGIEV